MDQPENKNFLSPQSFYLVFDRLPNVSYFCTSASIPQMGLSVADNLNTPFTKMPNPGDKITWSELNIKFRIDEDMLNYTEVYNWIVGLGYPDSFSQRAPFKQRPNPASGDITVFSDSSMIITTAISSPNIEIKFHNMFPVSLSSVEFDLNQSDVTYLEADCSLQYQKYEIRNL